MSEVPSVGKVTVGGQDYLMEDLVQEERSDGTYLVRRRVDPTTLDIVIHPVRGVSLL